MSVLDPGKEVTSFKKIVGGRTYEIASTMYFAFIDTKVEKIDLDLEFFGSSAEQPSWVSTLRFSIYYLLFRTSIN